MAAVEAPLAEPPAAAPPVQLQQGLKRTLDWFAGNQTLPATSDLAGSKPVLNDAREVAMKMRLQAEFAHVPGTGTYQAPQTKALGDAAAAVAGATGMELAVGPLDDPALRSK